MRCRPSYWLWGLIPIAILSWVAVQVEYDGIQNDLGRRAQEQLQRAGLGWAVANFSGRDGAVTGSAGDDNDGGRAIAIVRNVWGVRAAGDRSALIARADRFVWQAVSRGDGRLNLVGHVPSEEARKSILAAARAKFPKTDINDGMMLARGAPDQAAWLAGSTFALAQLSELRKGSVELAALDLTIIGEAASPPAYRNVKAAVNEGRPNKIGLAAEKITPPLASAYDWTARYTGDAVTISGLGPAEPAIAEITGRAKALFPNAKVANRTEVALGAPDGWNKALTVSLEQLAKLKSGEVEVRGIDLKFKGEAVDEATAAAVRKTLKLEVPQNYKVIEQIRYPREAQPDPAAGYVMAIAHDASTVEVSGMVPSEAARAALVDAVKARFPGRDVTDKTQIVAGAPEGWQQCVVAGLASLPRLKAGKSVLTDRRLVLSGTTDDYAASQTVPRDVKAAVGQTCEADADIEFTGEMKANLTWKATRGQNGMVALEGEVPDQATRDAIFETAQQLFPGISVTENMTIAGAPPEPWLTAARGGLAQLARLRRGELTIASADLGLKGAAESEAVASEVRAAVQSTLPEGFKGTHAIEVMSANDRAADECQELMRQATAKGTINFSRASADITNDSLETLRELSEIANECPQFRIEIEGHTDAEGTDERNQRLSDRRAAAVAEYLSRSGVDPVRLSTIGYGASKPISDNETEEGRARNRRIEFVVKVN